MTFLTQVTGTAFDRQPQTVLRGLDTQPLVLRGVRSRLAALRTEGLDPIEVMMEPAIWDRLQAENRIVTPGLIGRLAGRDVLGARVTLLPACHGIVIRYFGGMEVIDGG